MADLDVSAMASTAQSLEALGGLEAALDHPGMRQSTHRSNHCRQVALDTTEAGRCLAPIMELTAG